jgi:enoyl-CoA hydratase/carnithine racemase
MGWSMTVQYEVRERIAYISFNRPEKHNAMRDEDLNSLIVALGRLDTDPDADIGIIYGNGRSFSSGGDVSERLEASMDEGSSSGRTTEGGAFIRCENWKPIIAAVHGYCLGHALGTALLCDHLVAARDARFQVTEIKIGLPMTAFVPKLGHPAFANEVTMTGRMFSAEEAWEGGFVTRLVDEGKHVEAAEELSRLILSNPQSAVREHVRIRRALMAETAARYQAITGSFKWATSGEARDAVAARAAEMRSKSD